MAIIKVMLAGIGGYGDGYLKRLIELSDLGEVEVAGLVEPYPESCKRLDDVKSRGFRIYDTIERFYSESSCDLAVISSPIQFHTPMMLCALSHASHVLCEKPLTGDINDIDTLIDAREKSGCFVMIGYQWSHSEAILNIKRDIAAGIYGAPEFLKTIVLWPRNRAYFRRGSGWAGKIRDAEGRMINDSVANNATAHYLHNIFFTLGAAVSSDLSVSLAPDTTTAELYRANDIENFDTAIISCGFNIGADSAVKSQAISPVKSLYIASHAVDRTMNPAFEYRFEKGVISYDENTGRSIVGKLSDGSTHDYGDPFESQFRKLDLAIANAACDDRSKWVIPCGIETASAQVKCIAECTKQPIHNFAPERIRIGDGELVYADGLYDELVERYKQA